MFGWWGNKPAYELLLDEVYLSRSVADDVLVNRALKATGPVVVASFFGVSRERVGEALAKSGKPVEEFTRHSPITRSNGPWLLDAKRLARDGTLGRAIAGAAVPVNFLFIERYPSHRMEAEALERLSGFCEQVRHRVQFFVGLDQPLLAQFDGERLRGLMQQLGLSADEAITHSMVTKSIQRAQQKMDKAFPGGAHQAHSEEDWFRLARR